MKQKLKLAGIFTFEHIRNGKVIDTWNQDNLVVDEGLEYVLGNAFDGVTGSLTNWFVGLYSGNYTPVNTDTAANIAANATETTTAYSEVARPAWAQGGVVGNSIGNASSPAVFTFVDASTLVYGAMLISSDVKNGTGGVLAAAARFSSVRTMLASDVLNVSYSVSASSS